MRFFLRDWNFPPRSGILRVSGQQNKEIRHGTDKRTIYPGGDGIQPGHVSGGPAVLDSDADAEDAVDIDAVAGVSFGAWYIPINQDGTVGEGRWLSN